VPTHPLHDKYQIQICSSAVVPYPASRSPQHVTVPSAQAVQLPGPNKCRCCFHGGLPKNLLPWHSNNGIVSSACALNMKSHSMLCDSMVSVWVSIWMLLWKISCVPVHKLACKRPCPPLRLPGQRPALCEHTSMCMCAMGPVRIFLVSRWVCASEFAAVFCRH